MLLNFTIENFRSIYDEVELSMIASRERSHSEHLAKWSRHRILPIAAIYGANASGKSTYIQALRALQLLVVGTRSATDKLPVDHHLGLGKKDPVKLKIKILVNIHGRESAFVYEVKVLANRIIYEGLYKIGSNDESCLFERNGQDIEIYDPTFLANKRATMRAQSVEDHLTVLGVIGGAIEGPVHAVWGWFVSQLHIIFPGQEYVQLPARMSMDQVFADAMNQALSTVDTGITRLELTEVGLERFGRSSDELDHYQSRLRANGGAIVIPIFRSGPGLLELDDQGRLRGRILRALHEGGPGAPFLLDLAMESDGTRRFMNLLPILAQLEGRNDMEHASGVFVIDELENSLHPVLTEKILTDFLDTCGPGTRRQLIFTTHEVSLLRANLLRRDEMWVADRATSGMPSLYSVVDFSDMGARKGADIYTMYMSGQLGGIPKG